MPSGMAAMSSGSPKMSLVPRPCEEVILRVYRDFADTIQVRVPEVERLSRDIWVGPR